MKIFLDSQELGYVTDEVSTVPTHLANENKENRIKFVTDLAAISRGKYESSNPESRFNHLLSEAVYNPDAFSNSFSVTIEKNEDSYYLYLKENKTNILKKYLVSCPEMNRDSNKDYGLFTWIESIFNNEDKDNENVVTTEVNGNKLFNYISTEYWDNIDLLDKDTYPNKTTSPRNASRVLEFLPCIVYLSFYPKNNEWIIRINKRINSTLNIKIDFISLSGLLRFGYLEEGISIGETQYYTLYTNFRNVLNFYNSFYAYTKKCTDLLEHIYYDTDGYEDFKVLRIKAPMFVWAQFMTHTQLSKETQSDRVTGQKDYWLPEDIVEKIKKYKESSLDPNLDSLEEINFNTILNLFLNVLSQNQVQTLLKNCGYPREIWSRAPYYFKYKEFIMTGWINDPNAWGHLLLEREAYPKLHESWVQDETRKYADAIRKCLFYNNK